MLSQLLHFIEIFLNDQIIYCPSTKKLSPFHIDHRMSALDESSQWEQRHILWDESKR